jgi:hypothetical protein
MPEPETFAEAAPFVEISSVEVEAAFVAQLLEWRPGVFRIRITCYTRRAGGSSKDWAFAQIAPSMSPQEYRTLFHKMEKRGWFKGLTRRSS